VEPPPVVGGRELVTPEAYAVERLLRLHVALARFCAARGDLLALLSLPAHFHATEAETYQQQLRRRIVDEAESYAALYHPWLRTVSEDSDNGEARLLPPDGAVAGVFARRTRARGAWIAPANETLRAVVGLAPGLSVAAWEDLFTAQVNLIREDPRGFMPLSSFTLSEDPDLRQVNVRRLMNLLRRLVWREGNRLVFEPNSPGLRARLRQQFTRLLEDLYARGAFAGRTPREAFRVTADDTVNPPESVEQGRLVVELQVAPSRPLQFLTVRLVQEGLESLTVESA
jgi:phage tail sheath protein FI